MSNGNGDDSNHSNHSNHSNLALNLIEGAIAGAAATWVMGKVTSYLYEHEDKAARQQEDSVRDGKTAYGVAAEKVAELAGTSLSDDERKAESARIHWALGVGAGAVYGALRARVPQTGVAQGLGFGTAFWLLMDEGAVYALGLTPGPTKFPWQTHARGLAGHLVFGLVTDTTLSLLEEGA